MKPHEELKKNARLLVVDDELGMRDLLQLELSNFGYQVSTAKDAAEALDLLAKEKYHLVLSDIRMPQMDGIVLLEKIKEIDPSLEVIMMSGHGTVENAVRAMKKGAYDVILKPFNLEEMKMLIEKALEKKELRGLVALYESSKIIFSTVRLHDLCKMIIDEVVKTFKADEGSVMLLNEKETLSVAASRGIPEEVAQDIQVKIGERVAGYVAKTKEGLLLTDNIEKYPQFKGLTGNPRILSSVVCPLLNPDGALLGVLSLNRTKMRQIFTLSDLHAVSIFASLASLAIANAKLFAELEAKIGELRLAQDQLFQSEKLASIGRLVAGVAHELNNPLTSVIGYSQLASRSDDKEEIRRSLPIIYEQALRCSKIVKDLLIFARQKTANRQSVDIYEVINESLGGVSLELQKRKIQVVWERPEKKPLLLWIDPFQMKQVFSNLLTNAFQALGSAAGERKIFITAKAEKEKVCIYLQDNGPGIPNEIAGKIFDPFFTTKDVGQGTGLGLSLSYGIIKEHGGTLSVQRGRTQGACFVVELPVEGIPKAVPEEKTPRRDAPPGAVFQKVLIVEDEEPIRKLMMAILQNRYDEFDAAEDGRTAFEKIKKNSYDLILCDYRVPLLNGFALFQEVKKIKPEAAQRFLFVSGSTIFRENYEEFFQKEKIACLLKPFTKEELLEAVGKIKPARTAGKEPGNGS